MMQRKTNKIFTLLKFFRTHPFGRLASVIFLLVPIYIILYKIYIPIINAFGCFDDCFNFAGGYFLGKGKTLFSEIYFNHQPLMAYISLLIQRYANPINIYGLLLSHRQSLILFSFVFQVLLCWRFGIIGLVSMFIYEFTKFWVFGDRFLAEGYIVYPLIYLIGLMMITIQKRRVYSIELIFASVCTWFVVFMREPYIPLALFLFFLIIRKKINTPVGFISLLIFFTLTALLFCLFPVQDYVNNVIILNILTMLKKGLTPNHSSMNVFLLELLKSFFYPLYIFISGLWTENRIILITLSSMYLLSTIMIVKSKKNVFLSFFLFIALGLANFRPTKPGLQYYQAFYMIVWYGLFTFSTMYIFYEVASNMRKKYVFFVCTIPLMLYIFFSPRSFIYQNTDSHAEFIINYGHYIGIGEVIKALSQPNQTMFTDGNEELLYWQAKRSSAYQYSFYYPAEKNSKYYAARLQMFIQNPPDFYYDFCIPVVPSEPSIPADFIHLYRRLYEYGKPSCLYLKASLIPTITSEQWKKAKEFEYTLEENL